MSYVSTPYSSPSFASDLNPDSSPLWQPDHFRSLTLSSPTLFPPNSRYARWTQAVFNHPAFVATTSTEDLYLDSYARYAENRPNTSQVAKAINEGRELLATKGKGGKGGEVRERGRSLTGVLCFLS